jgi:hypothetical protein
MAHLLRIGIFEEFIIDKRFLIGFGGYLRSNHPLAAMLLLLVEFVCYFRCVDYWKLLDVYLFRFYHLG